MPNENQLVRTITEPTIVIDDIRASTDENTAEENIDNSISAAKTSKQLGGVMPVIQILTKIFTGQEVSSVRIESHDFLPTCHAELLIMDKSFYSRSFPKDGDVMSIFIRSKDDVLKPIRNDYIITNVNIVGRFKNVS